MRPNEVKHKQLEKSLCQLGTLAAMATDELALACYATQSAEKKLMQIQSEIEQIYMTLEEPLSIVTKKE